MKSWALAISAMRAMSSRLAPGFPYSMFSRMVPPKRMTSWGTMAIWARRQGREISAAWTSSKVMRPDSG